MSSSSFPLSPPVSHHKSRHPAVSFNPIQNETQSWIAVNAGTDAPRTAERKRRGRMVDYIDRQVHGSPSAYDHALTSPPNSLPTPPSTKNNRSRRHHAQEHSAIGLPTPSTSARKQTGSQQAHDHRASPISKSRRLGGDGIDLEAEAEEGSGSSETEQTTATVVTEKRWLGRRGKRRPGLTFAQQMGLLVARPAEQHRLATTNVVPSDWRPTGISNGITEGVVEKSFYFNAESVSARERSEITLSLSKNATIQENPFLDDSDRSTVQVGATLRKVPTQLRKTASGRLLDPVDVISPESHTRDLARASDVGSETEKEQVVEEDEEDDSPYLIENSSSSPAHDNLAPGVVQDAHEQESRSFVEERYESSDLSEIDDTEDDENGPDSESMEIRHSSVELASIDTQTTTNTGRRRPPSITSFLSATKGSPSDIEKDLSATPRPSSIPGRRPRKFREKKMWGKPVLGDEEDNPFIAPSTTGKPKNQSSETAGGGSWLRTDNAKNRRSEGEKPTIDYLFRGQKTTFANPYYRHDPYRPPATSLLPPEHPEFSPAPVPAPRMLFPHANTEEGNSSEDDNGKAMLRMGRRRDILPGHMATSPTASSSTAPTARTLQRRISSQIPPMVRQGSTLHERAQRLQTRRPAQSQAITQPQTGAQKRSMDAVLDGAVEGNDDEDELLLEKPRAGRRMLFGAGAGAAGSRAHSDQHQNGQAARTTANKKVKMEHIMGE